MTFTKSFFYFATATLLICSAFNLEINPEENRISQNVPLLGIQTIGSNERLTQVGSGTVRVTGNPGSCSTINGVSYKCGNDGICANCVNNVCTPPLVLCTSTKLLVSTLLMMIVKLF